MQIYNSRGPKQTWHHTPRERVKEMLPQWSKWGFFAPKINGLQHERIWAPSCGWIGESGTLQKLCSPYLSPWGGLEESWDGETFFLVGWRGALTSKFYGISVVNLWEGEKNTRQMKYLITNRKGEDEMPDRKPPLHEKSEWSTLKSSLVFMYGFPSGLRSQLISVDRGEILRPRN